MLIIMLAIFTVVGEYSDTIMLDKRSADLVPRA
jgi:hypothetical protein